MKSIIGATTRDKGYINLDNILNLSSVTNFEEFIHTLKNNKNITIESVTNSNGNTQLVFSFQYGESEYFYKYDNPREPFKVSPYNELVAGEIANDLFIPHVDYDLAVVCGFKGLISKDFRQRGVQYISGKEFLVDNHPLGKDGILANLNNLEDIQIALEKYSDGKIEYQSVVNKVMKKIVLMFIFDILTGQVDRGYSNWYLMKYFDGTLDLQPLFDNIRILVLHHYMATERYPSVSKLLLTVNRDIIRYCEDNLEEFLKSSDEEFIAFLLNSLWAISEENIQKIFTRIEDKTEYSMPFEWKQYYLKEFKSQSNFIGETYNRIDPFNHKL